jgi:ferritin-like metal-binding protein YciE
MPLQNLHDFYVETLKDLYSAETQILEALPLMAAAASHAELKAGFEHHFTETEGQVRRLLKIFDRLGEKPDDHHCKGMEGLLKEGEELMKEKADLDVLDAALIASAQKVEHYEMAGYGCARTYAEMLGYTTDAELLQQTLDEEGNTDKKLTAIAERAVNPHAMR